MQGGERESAQILNQSLQITVREALWNVIAEEVSDLCGTRYAPDQESLYHRAGSEQGGVYLGGEKESIRRPRVRHEEDGEVELES